MRRVQVPAVERELPAEAHVQQHAQRPACAYAALVRAPSPEPTQRRGVCACSHSPCMYQQSAFFPYVPPSVRVRITSGATYRPSGVHSRSKQRGANGMEASCACHGKPKGRSEGPAGAHSGVSRRRFVLAAPCVCPWTNRSRRPGLRNERARVLRGEWGGGVNDPCETDRAVDMSCMG